MSAKASADIYRITPLKWSKLEKNGYSEKASAGTSRGDYKVERYREDWEENKPWAGWQVRYCFVEYYDEGEVSVESLAEGKKWAEDDWQRRMIADLTPAKAIGKEAR